jgi:selenium metabolism protein YedF
MFFIDCRGKTCPVPVIETKKAVESQSPTDLKVAVDNEVSRENVKRFLESKGYRVSIDAQGEDIFVVGKIETLVSEVKQEKKVTAFINAQTLGRGDDQLGAILMKSFIFTLKELNPLPWRIIFVNAGVKLASEGSELLAQLQELENLGVEILSCGTCLDFYHLKEKLKVGRISNMFEIVTSLTESTTVLKP